MPNFSRILLHDNKVDAVKRFHPWIFSGAIKKKDMGIKEGEIVDVYSNSGEYLATGHYSSGNIAVKIFSFQKVSDLDRLFLEKFQNAYGMRKQLGLATSQATNCYRLINAEGDGLPGLIVDWYNGTAVLQAYSLGMYDARSLIVECLQKVYGQDLNVIYDKSASILGKEVEKTENRYLFGSKSEGEILEYGHRFLVNWEEGQKTGFFIDQRESRWLLAKYVAGKRVLNTFCYSGGFSVYAIAAGASFVHSVDSSLKAIEWTTQNVALNNPRQTPYQTSTEDIFNFLKTCDTDYDTIVLDPPAFAKSLSARHQAVMAYKRLNKEAIAKLRSPGILFTFSCSQVVAPEHFRGAVVAAAIESGRAIRVLHHLTQPADHPVSIYHPEGLYLKGLVLRVD
jgi:23S rRNA (cytosine1962-C5)-methyltransferase